MNAVSHPNTASLVQAYPTGSSGRIDKRIQDGPVGNGITTIHHGFRFAVWRSHGTSIQVITANNNRCVYFFCSHEFVKCQSRYFSFSLTQPADPGGQSLESNFFFSQFQPALERIVLRKKTYHQFVCNCNILRIATEGHPPEGTLALTKKRTDISRNKTGKIKRIFQSFFVCACPDIIPIIKCNCAFFLQGEHFFYMK